MAENFPYLGEETNIQVQEAESRRHYKKKKKKLQANIRE